MARALRFLLVNMIAGAVVCVVLASTADECAAQTAGTATPATKPKVSKGKTKSAAAAKKNPAEAQKALDAGIRAYQTGKFDVALQQLDRAMADGGLPANQVARALYYRGIVHRKQSKPALAISDLTNALWLKGGLSEQERANAISHRTQAYREAGLTEPGSTETAAAASSSTEPRAATRGRETSPTVAAAAEQTSESSSSGIAGFFSNLFSAGSSSSPSAALTSDSSPEATPTRPPPSPSRSVGTSWSSTTEPTAAPPPKPDRKRVARAPTPARDLTTGSVGPPASGGIRINIATLRSHPEALAVVDRVKREHSGSLTGEPTIIETTTGSSPAFSVRIGPYVNAEQSRELCARLRKSGLECVILAK